MMQIDLQSSFVVGSFMGFLARRRFAKADPAFLAGTRTAVLIFGGIVFAPVWLYVILAYTPWETMYLWDLDTVPHWLVTIMLPLLSAFALAGFWLTQWAATRGKMWVTYAANALMLLTIAIVTIRGWERARFVGTLDEFAAGGGSNFFASDLALTFAIATVIIFAPAAMLIGHWLRTGRIAD